MAQFSYTAKSRTGETKTGVVDAADRRAALAAVSRLGLLPVRVEAGAAGAAPGAKALPPGKGGKAPAKKRGGGMKLSRPNWMSAQERALFTNELADLLEGGMTLGNALNALARRGDDGSGRSQVIVALRDAIVGGESFSAALSRFPKVFSPVYVAMIRAGEASGAMDDVLRRLIDQDERIQNMKSKIRSAMVYPAVVLCMGVAVAVFAMTFILPKFESIFAQMGADGLPPMTRALLGANAWFKKYWLLLVALGVGGFFAFKRWTATERGRRAWDGFKLRAPLVKGMVACGVYASFASTLESLLRNGVPILRALAITGETVGNAVVGDELAKARDRVTDGTTISGPLEQGGVFPPMVIDMIAIGERTGDMPRALGHVAKRYERELQKNITIFTTALEPIMIAAVALVVAFIAVAIMQAVMSVTNGMNVR